MMSKDSAHDQELLERFRRASDGDSAAPSDAVRAAILAESRRVAGQLADRAQPAIDTSSPAANDSRWKITAFGTLGAALFAALLIAPRYFESEPAPKTATPQTSQGESSKPQTYAAQAPAPQISSAPSEARKSARAMRSNSASAQPVPPPAALADSTSSLAAPSVRGGLLSRSAGSATAERNALTPASLQSAAALGDASRTSALLEQGAAIDARDQAGRTALMLAVMQNHADVVRLLLARGADPNVADDAGRTPLQLAVSMNSQEIAGALRHAGAR